jgi:transposase-like protein
MRISKSRFTFAEVSRPTSTEADAIAFAERLRWRDEITCHRWASTDDARLGGRPGRYRCRTWARQFSIRTGTPMESSRLPVATWLRALRLIMSSSKGISSLRLADMLGIRQRSAWFLAHRVRKMMAWVVRAPISGDAVELDEVYRGQTARESPRRPDGGEVRPRSAAPTQGERPRPKADEPLLEAPLGAPDREVRWAPESCSCRICSRYIISNLRLSLGRTWLCELGCLGPPHCVTVLAREIEPRLSD